MPIYENITYKIILVIDIAHMATAKFDFLVFT